MVLAICLGMAGPTDVGEYLEAVNVATIEGAAVWIRIRTLLKLMLIRDDALCGIKGGLRLLSRSSHEGPCTKAEKFEPSLIKRVESFRFVRQRNSADYSRALMSHEV